MYLTMSDRMGPCEVNQDMMETYRQLFTIREAARYLNLSERTIRRLISGGEIETVRRGRLVRIPAGELDVWIEAHTTRLPATSGSERTGGV